MQKQVNSPATYYPCRTNANIKPHSFLLSYNSYKKQLVICKAKSTRWFSLESEENRNHFNRCEHRFRLN